ncbi:MAG: class I SAM-dependent RNA methyltransferase [Bacteroidales bacterium]|nr:class I SAM-dependent RNA methyltransferase [Bacteroidales bacterium]
MKITAKTLFGLENILAEELRGLGAAGVRPVNRAVLFSGGLELLYKVNYNSRFALSFLVSVDEFRISSKDDLYARTLLIDWSGIIDPDTTFSVVSVVNSRLFGHTAFPGLVVKDAIADHFRKRSGRRPSVNTSDPDIVVNLHISNENVNISIDSSVVPLYRRGYRKSQGPAPLNEVLAAGIVKLSGWDASFPLIDPMCGSGTIPVEAGLMALNIPPGSFRKTFGFTKWKNHDEELFRKVRSQSDSKVAAEKLSIGASDISAEAVAQAELNIASAGLSDVISLRVADFRDLRASPGPGWLIFNPPYGERIKPSDIEALYSMTGSTMKHNFPGYRAWILTQGKELLKHIGLKPRSKTTLYNGPIECILAGYELYEGSRKKAAD